MDPANTVPAQHRRLRDAAARRGVPLATILVTVTVVVLVYLAGKLAYRIRDVLLMIAIAGFISLILNPLVVTLQRWGIRRRGWAVALVTTWTVIVFIGLLAAFGYPLAHGVAHFSHVLPSYVQAAEHGRGWIGHLITRFHLAAWVTRNAPKLQSLGTTLAKPALTVGKGAASFLATLATIFALIVLFLLEGPKMRQSLLGLMAPERAEYTWPIRMVGAGILSCQSSPVITRRQELSILPQVTFSELKGTTLFAGRTSANRRPPLGVRVGPSPRPRRQDRRGWRTRARCQVRSRPGRARPRLRSPEPRARRRAR
jgi:hypothetical protein